MIEPFILTQTVDKPEVILDPERNKFEISGKSLPEDARLFFDPIIEWIEAYAKEPNKETIFHLKLSYFNSSSARKIVEALSVLESIPESGNTTEVVWHYKNYDDIMKERGEELKLVLDIPFELRAY